MFKNKLLFASISFLLTNTVFAYPISFTLLNASSEGKVMEISYQICDNLTPPKKRCLPPATVTLNSSTFLTLKGMDSEETIWPQEPYFFKIVEKKDGKEVATMTSKYGVTCTGGGEVKVLQDHNTNKIMCKTEIMMGD